MFLGTHNRDYSNHFTNIVFRITLSALEPTHKHSNIRECPLGAEDSVCGNALGCSKLENRIYFENAHNLTRVEKPIWDLSPTLNQKHVFGGTYTNISNCLPVRGLRGHIKICI